MIEVKGKFNTAKIFTDHVESGAINQIRTLLDQEWMKDSKVRVMPDVHEGAGCTIGTTFTISDKIVSNLVGVDIGCGMETVYLQEHDIDLKKLDEVIHKYIPSGFNVRDTPHEFNSKINIDDLVCAKDVKVDRAKLSLGTLGGGNHFIEVDKDYLGNLHLVIHSGSRNIGQNTAIWYQQKAIKTCTEKGIRKDLAYLEGKYFDDYLHDMKIMQEYADLNRKAMVDVILDKMNLNSIRQFTTTHNYIDLKNNILRKGAVSAQEGEELLVPINMRDGAIIATGKGNSDWNYSSPHGAGRLMSRGDAKRKFKMEDFIESMRGIYSTSVNQSTLDESPMAYKSMDEILKNVEPTLKIDKIIKPIYNFKAAE